MRLAQGAFALQVKSYFQNRFDFFFGKVQVADQVSAMKICLHVFTSPYRAS